MDTIEKELDRLAEKLPTGYEVRICVEKDAGWVEVRTPNGETTSIDDADACWVMLLNDALGFCRYDANAKGQPQPPETGMADTKSV